MRCKHFKQGVEESLHVVSQSVVLGLAAADLFTRITILSGTFYRADVTGEVTSPKDFIVFLIRPGEDVIK